VTARIICGLFFLSGMAALLFQTLWFRLAGLSLGNGVWAGSLVLGSFMAGLAAGNALATRRGERGARALRLYARLELIIGVTGAALVLLLPFLPGFAAGLFRPGLDRLWLLNSIRLGVAFLLLLVPSVAMGATLPLLVSAISDPGRDFGHALGRLYGWNTLGAVAGALAGEGALFGLLGLSGSGMVAAALNGAAAAGAFALSRSPGGQGAPVSEAAPLPRIVRWPRGPLSLAALSGGLLLALEVIWFRFLQLYVVGTSRTFAVMLAIVLLGIALGGLLGGFCLAARPKAYHWLPGLALIAGLVTATGYVSFDAAVDGLGVSLTSSPLLALVLGAWLMLPTCLASGLLFTFLGRALKEELVGETLTTGALTLANTAGATVGALAGGFVLLPAAGVERSFFFLSLGYGLLAAVAAGRAGLRPSGPAERRVAWALAALLAALLALFPFGLMAKVHLARVAGRYDAGGYRSIAFREGLTETILYMQRDLFGEPVSHRLVTNGFSMSGTDFVARRYMKLFVYWALAVRPEARKALLISYGCGSTAKALTDARGLTSIDVVDISREILELGRVAFPPPETAPLDDPRVRVHIEDGRFFLLTTDRRFDLITAEPPPPRTAGIVNLYSREFFALVRDRLDEGGVVTYWLPVHDLQRGSMRSIVAGFCDVFPDCSLWTGSGFDWMLAGRRGARGPVAEDAFAAQWRDPRTGPALAELAFPTPAHLGATFLADAPLLRILAADTAPLVDDFPRRLSPGEAGEADHRFYLSFMDATAARDRFARSDFIRTLWPSRIREATLAAFAEQDVYNQSRIGTYGLMRRDVFPLLYHALTETSSPLLPLLVAGSEPREQAAAARAVSKGVASPLADYLLGLGALARREYAAAEAAFSRVARAEPGFHDLALFRALALCLAGDAPRAAPFLDEIRRGPARDEDARRFWAELEGRCGREGRPRDVAEGGLDMAP